MAGPSSNGPHRKRKIHRKSRQGCRNCKIRHVKCDETRPGCTKCLDFGVKCNLSDPTIPDLQPGRGDAACMEMQEMVASSFAVNEAMLDMINRSLSHGRNGKSIGVLAPSRLKYEELDRLRRFQTSTCLTIGSDRGASVMHEEVLRMACTHRFVMHLVQTIVAIHDRHLNSPSDSTEDMKRRSTVETYHLSQAAAFFNDALSKPIRPDDRDALWSAAALLGCVSFASIDARTPEEAWPLKPPSDTDLEWLTMSEGKGAVWKITNPLRKDSVWHRIAPEYERDYLSAMAPKKSRSRLLPIFAQLCSLDDGFDGYEDDDTRTKEEIPIESKPKNPYRDAIYNLLPLLDIECNGQTIVRFLGFISYIYAPFKQLLEQKEPRALLILAYWYSKICGVRWWLSRRVEMEGPAIVLYLERYHQDDFGGLIGELLRFPKSMFGI